MWVLDEFAGMADQNPIAAAFELQRRSLRQSQQALEQSIELQRQLNEAMMQGTGGTDASERTAEMTRAAIERYLEAIESTVPGAGAGVEQVREAMAQQFEAAEQVRSEAADLAEEGLEGYDDLSAVYLDSVSQQLDVLVDAHEEVEKRTEQFLDRTEEQLEEMQEDTSDQLQEQLDQLHERTEELRERMRS